MGGDKAGMVWSLHHKYKAFLFGGHKESFSAFAWVSYFYQFIHPILW